MLLKISNLIQFLASVLPHCSVTFSVDFLGFFIKNTTFWEFEVTWKQIHKEKETQYNDEKEIIDSNIDLLKKFQIRNRFLKI